MLYYTTENHYYTNTLTIPVKKQDIFVPLEIDTEFQEDQFPYKKHQAIFDGITRDNYTDFKE